MMYREIDRLERIITNRLDRIEAVLDTDRIAVLEQQNALLLAYIRANEAWRHHPHDEGLTDAADAAMDALSDAGLLEDAPQEAHNSPQRDERGA